MDLSKNNCKSIWRGFDTDMQKHVCIQSENCPF